MSLALRPVPWPEAPAGRSVRKNVQLLVVATLTVGFFLMAIYVFHLNQSAPDTENQSETRYTASWPLSQATVEVARLAASMGAYGASPSDEGLLVVETWLDIVMSRVEVIRRSPIFQTLREDDDAMQTLAALSNALARGEELLAGPIEIRFLIPLMEVFNRTSQKLAQLAARTYVTTTREAEAQAEKERQVHVQTQRMLLALFGISILFILLLIRSNLLLHSTSAELSAVAAQQQAAWRANTLQNAQFSAALDNMVQGLCMFTAQAELIVCNARFLEMFNIPPERAQPGKSLDVVLRTAWEIPAASRNLLLALLAAPTRWEADHGNFLQPFEDGRELAFACRPLDHGGWLVTFEDVTQQRRNARDSLRLARDLASVIETMPGAVMRLLFDAASHWRPIFISETIERLTGFTAAEAAAADWWEKCTSEADQKRLSTELRAFPIGRERLAEFHFRKKDGNMIWLRMALRMESSADQEITAVIICTDVTAERALRERLTQSTKLAQLGEVATGVAHELNQPLAAISLAAENALESLSRIGERAPHASGKLERILQLVARATQVIDHMRVFGRIGGAAPESVPLGPIVAGAETLMRSKMRTVGVRLECEWPADLPNLLVHATPIEQVFMNLIGNACDAYLGLGRASDGEPMVIRISACLSGGMVKISVADQAGGIPTELLPRIFEPFFTTKEVGSGTGLGLSISYGIVTEMGGTIDAETRDGGTVFTITLPIALSA